MKSVVMIAYSFPPAGDAGVYRPLRFVRHLPMMGWLTRVICLDADYYDRYDPGLLALVPSETEVVRVRSRDLWQAIQARRAKRIREQSKEATAKTEPPIRAAYHRPIRSVIREGVRIAEAWCYHPDMAMCWIRPAVNATVKLCARKRPNVIWATGGPWSSFVVARRASQLTRVPYVLDFRDPWILALSEFEVRRPVWAQRRDRRTLYRLLGGAHAIIFRYHAEAECYWRIYQDALDATKIHIIPNGYEGRIDEFVAAEQEKLMILYTGTLTPYRYDTLLQALSFFKQSNPSRVKQLRILFVGEGMEALADEAKALGLSDIVEASGPVSYAEVTRLQRNAHALLLLGVKPYKGHEFAGSKIFGYFKAARPILAVLAEGEAKKILQRVGVSTVADVNSPPEIIAVLQHLLDAWSAGTLASLLPDRVACAAYSAERQTAALVRALEGAPAAEPFVPGCVEIPPSLRGEIGDGG